MFESLARGGFNAAYAALPIQDKINQRISRYGSLRSFRKEKDGYHVVVQLLGAENPIELVVKEIHLSADKQKFILHGFESSQTWLVHLLEDHVQDKEFPVPEFPGKEQLLKFIPSF